MTFMRMGVFCGYMNTRSILVLLPLLAIVAMTAGSSVALADVYSYNGTNYTIPAGYQSYQGGIFYNPSTGMYYNPVTGVSANTPLPSITGGTYSVPSGYVAYNANTYYNPSMGMYFNPFTGQISNVAPNSPQLFNQNGTVIGMPGYSSYGYGVYYNPSTNSYWDSTTGYFSNTPPNYPQYTVAQPVYQQPQQVVYAQPAVTYTVAQAIPALPNTGAGGDAGTTLMILAASVVAMLGGFVALRKLA